MRTAIVLFVTFGLLGTASGANKITIGEARKVALVRVPGTIVHESLKHKKKKGHDHYNFKITPRDHPHKGTVRKVEVDAETGEILKIKDVIAKSPGAED